MPIRDTYDALAVEERIFSERPYPKWHSVETDPPPVGIQVLILTNQGTRHIARFDVVESHGKSKRTELFRTSPDTYFLKERVTHWHPLPLPPNDE